jgi:hypothetical protein
MFKKNLSMKSKLKEERKEQLKTIEEREIEEREIIASEAAFATALIPLQKKPEQDFSNIVYNTTQYDEEGNELFPKEKEIIYKNPSKRYNQSLFYPDEPQRAYDRRIQEEKYLYDRGKITPILKYNEIKKLIGRTFEMYIDSVYVGDYKYKGEIDDDMVRFVCVQDCNNYIYDQQKVIPISELVNSDSVYQFINLHYMSRGGRKSRKFQRKIRRKSRKILRKKSRK